MYYLAECLIIKDENQYLREHLTRNSDAGIEHFYIFDNLSAVPVSEYIRLYLPQFADRCTVQTTAQTQGYLQSHIYNQFVKQHVQDITWCAFIDTDEIFEGDLGALCRQSEAEGWKGIQFRQVMHGCNGHAHDSGGDMWERFMPHTFTRFSYVKNVVRLSKVRYQEVHKTEYNDLSGLIQKNLKPTDTVKLHHFYYRSFEEYIKKCLRGDIPPFRKLKINDFFLDNTIDEKERDLILSKYGLTLNSRMTYNAN